MQLAGILIDVKVKIKEVAADKMTFTHGFIHCENLAEKLWSVLK